MSRQPTIVQQACAYLAHRRAHGFALKSQGTVLLQFARFANDAGVAGGRSRAT